MRTWTGSDEMTCTCEIGQYWASKGGRAASSEHMSDCPCFSRSMSGYVDGSSAALGTAVLSGIIMAVLVGAFAWALGWSGEAMCAVVSVPLMARLSMGELSCEVTMARHEDGSVLVSLTSPTGCHLEGIAPGSYVVHPPARVMAEYPHLESADESTTYACPGCGVEITTHVDSDALLHEQPCEECELRASIASSVARMRAES